MVGVSIKEVALIFYSIFEDRFVDSVDVRSCEIIGMVRDMEEDVVFICCVVITGCGMVGGKECVGLVFS